MAFRKSYRKRTTRPRRYTRSRPTGLRRAKTDYGTSISGSNPILKKLQQTTAHDMWSMAKLGYQGAKWIAGIINSEKKLIDNVPAVFTLPVIAAANTPTLFWADLEQGTSEAQRIGNSVLVKSIQANMQFNLLAGAPRTVRMIVIRDLQYNGVSPTLADILEAPTNIQSPLNILNGNAESRFSVINDKFYTLDTVATPRIQTKYFQKMMVHTRFIGPSTAVGDKGLNQIYVFFMVDTADSVSLGFYGRTRFYDN